LLTVNFFSIRGALGAMIVVTCNLGILVGYIINSYLNYYTVPYIVVSIFIVFFIGFPFASESPKHLVMQNHIEAAVASLKYFRGYEKKMGQYSKEFQEELQTLTSYRQPGDISEKSKLTMKDFCECNTFRKCIWSI
jgi:Sugar (and other) transporter